MKLKTYFTALLISLCPILIQSHIPLEEDKPMFAVIYRGYTKPGFDEEYQKYWKKIATYFVQERGALGSTLHQTEDGMWVAYSKWPDKATRDASWPRNKEAVNAEIPLVMQEVIEGLRACLDEDRQLPEICMEIKETILVK